MANIRKMLSDLNTPTIRALESLAKTQSKETLVVWALDYSELVLLPIWRKYYPEDSRPINALKASREWLAGEIKLPQAKVAILECHAAAREADANPAAQATARAIGQSASAIHSTRHCIGLALYGGLAVAYDILGTDASWDQLEKYAEDECGRMLDALRSSRRKG